MQTLVRETKENHLKAVPKIERVKQSDSLYEGQLQLFLRKNRNVIYYLRFSKSVKLIAAVANNLENVCYLISVRLYVKNRHVLVLRFHEKDDHLTWTAYAQRLVVSK